MLTDQEVVELRKTKEYKSLTGAGLHGIVSDLVAAGDGDLRADASTLLKFVHGFTKNRLVRNEMTRTRRQFIERILNRELGWQRSPQSVKDICDAPHERYLWMRYDEARVRCLCTSCIELISEAPVRDLIKRHSSLEEGAMNARLAELTQEMKDLRRETIQSIRAQGIFNGIIDFTKDEFFEDNEDVIRERFIRAGTSGLLSEPGERPGPPEAPGNG